VPLKKLWVKNDPEFGDGETFSTDEPSCWVPAPHVSKHVTAVGVDNSAHRGFNTHQPLLYSDPLIL
jgi:hypothetical protein